MTRFHPGTFVTGLVFAVLGSALMGEAAGWWTLRLRHLGLIFPIVLVVIGLATLVGSTGRSREAAG